MFTVEQAFREAEFAVDLTAQAMDLKELVAASSSHAMPVGFYDAARHRALKIANVDGNLLERAAAKFVVAKAQRIGEKLFSERTVGELARQASFRSDRDSGMLGELVRNRRRAPLSPQAFAELISTKQFTNNADTSAVIELYRKTATALLGCINALSFESLDWSEVDYINLGKALRSCNMLTSLSFKEMRLSDHDLSQVLDGAPVPSLHTLELEGCRLIRFIPSISPRVLPSLQTLSLKGSTFLTDQSSRPLGLSQSLTFLDLEGCGSLTHLPPDLGKHVALRGLSLRGCNALRKVPDLSHLTSLRFVDAGGTKLSSTLARKFEEAGVHVDIRKPGER